MNETNGPGAVVPARWMFSEPISPHAAPSPHPAPADVVTPSSTPELADLLRKRYPRLLERGNPLYDGVLAAAVERAGAADVVTVPREEWEGYQTAKTGFRFAKGWTMICTEDLDALRSSAQAGEGGAP